MHRKRYKYLIIIAILLSLSCSQLDNILKFLKDKFKLEKKDKNKDKKREDKKKDKKKDNNKTKKDNNKTKKIEKKDQKDKKNVTETVIIYKDKEYLNTFYGRLSKNIAIKFLKNNKKKYKIKNIDNKFDPYKENNSFIIISDKNYKNLNKSKELFSDALYFLIQREYEKEFKYPSSLKKMSVGVHYGSYVYNYINEINPITGKKNYEIGTNYKIYAEFNNMIEDFTIKKIDIVMINRTEYYKLQKTLPSAFLFYIDIGKTFGYLYFKDKNLLKEFNDFTNKNKIKYDWIDFL